MLRASTLDLSPPFFTDAALGNAVFEKNAGMGVLDRTLGIIAGGVEIAAVAVILFAAV